MQSAMHKKLSSVVLLIASAALLPASILKAQDAGAPAPATAAASRVVGSLVKIDGQKLTLKDQKGVETTVSVTDSTRLAQVAPGQTNLASATPIKLADIQPGDRLLVRVQPAPDGSGMVATIVVAMRQADIAQQHAQILAAWQHGVGGLVKSVDTADQTVVIAAGTVAHPRDVTIKFGPKTVVKRYAPESVEYDQAVPSSLDKVTVGDQLRARGAAGADPASFAADEVIAGSFRNISGKINAVDVTTGTLSLTDLATKQPVQLKVTADSHLRKLDDATAEKLAAQMKPAGEGGGRPAVASAAGGPPSEGPPSGGMGGMHRGPGAGASGGGGDMQQALAQAPAIKLTDLRKGDVVMAVASNGADNQLGAVTVVAGVDPLLRASPSASAAVLASWSLAGSNAPAEQ